MYSMTNREWYSDGKMAVRYLRIHHASLNRLELLPMHILS